MIRLAVRCVLPVIQCLAIALVLTPAAFGAERLQIGPWHSRALWSPAPSKAPLIIMIPGSGPNGPEEAMAPDLTGDAHVHFLFDEFKKPFEDAGFNVLALGKPGVEFFSTSDPSAWFYDQALYAGLRWKDLVANLASAVEYSKNLPTVDPTRIYIFGHSEGTQVAIDYAKENPQLAGLILVGLTGEDMATVLDWQLFERVFDLFVKPDVDLDHDGWITKDEASPWQDYLSWDFSTSDRVSIDELRKFQRSIPALQDAIHRYETKPLYADGVFRRGPIYAQAAALRMPLFVLTGTMDVRTRPEESLQLAQACASIDKQNCHVTLVPGLTHGMSKPRSPRGHRLLDETLGPVDPSFLELESDLARELLSTQAISTFDH